MTDRAAAFLQNASTVHSSAQENLLEHVFISEVLQETWFGRGQVVEVLRSEVDAGGYDLVFECGIITRHVQLKSSAVDGKTAHQTLNIRLAEKPSGCVVWLRYKPIVELGRVDLTYLWFGGEPGQSLPSLGDQQGRRPSRGILRPNARVVRKSRFEAVSTTAELVTKLFGPPF
jgi:hypothetical protein